MVVGLSLDSNHWPVSITKTKSSSDDITEKRRVHASVNVSVQHGDGFSLINRFSNLKRLQHITAYCLRFINNIKYPRELRQHKDLSVAELDNAEKVLIKMVQKESFLRDIKDLNRSGQVQRSSKLLRFNPFLDNHHN